MPGFEADALTGAAQQREPASVLSRTPRLIRASLEGLAVLVSPIVAVFGLRITLMSPPDLNDPAMHTTFVINPSDVFARYSAVLAPTDRLREGARVGFLIPARVSYLLFGAVPGFIVFRYVLALIALVPVYLLLRRLYGRIAGAIAVIVVLSCPVIILAWGTDFPDSAAVSYLIGGLACLAMPSLRHRFGWVLGSAVLFTLALWALAASAPLIIVTLVVYARIDWVRERKTLVRDAALMGGAFVAVTGLLAVGSGLLIGPLDYIQTTIASLLYLAQPSQVHLNHSANPLWAPYITYLLVPPAVVGLWFVAFAKPLRTVPTPQLLVGMACLTQLLVFGILQLAGGVQDLEVHYFSSLLWGAVCITLAIVIVELGRPIYTHRVLRWVLPGLPLAVPLIFEIHPRVPQFGWVPWGILLAALVVILGIYAVWLGQRAPTMRTMALIGVSLTAIIGGLLGLTVTPTQHARLRGTVVDTFPAYAGTLGGNDTVEIDLYSVTTQLPAFVGPPSYSGERLVTWWSDAEIGLLREPIGMFHAFFNSIPSDLGVLSTPGHQYLEQTKPAQVLLMSFNGAQFPASLGQLTQFQPVVVRIGVIRSGSLALHLWLIDLKVYER
ncbi:MAG TPA: hypothetical protein VMU65_11505 [Candidatus Saccharimonadales bacterium]|nr:hypothetical protein [Candidatus Saccharimonadales bacterium]